MLPFIGIILVILIFILLNLDSPLKNKINAIINMMFIIIILLIINAYLLYPQYQNSKNTQEIIKELENFLQDWNDLWPRSSGTGEKNDDSRINYPDAAVPTPDSDYKNPGIPE